MSSKKKSCCESLMADNGVPNGQQANNRKDIDLEMQMQAKQATKKSSPQAQNKKNKCGACDGLDFFPYARYIVSAALYFLFVCGIMGIIAGIAGLARGNNTTQAYPSTDFPLPNQNLVERILMLISGVYSLFIIPFILFWHTICSFNKEDKSTDAMLEPHEWPQFITKPLTVLNHPFFNCVFCIILAIPLFTSIYTCTSGAFLLMGALVYFIAGCKREKIPRITGIRVVQS